MKIEVVNIKKIIVLHTEITEALKSSLEKAILIGQLLTEQKKELNHGEFTSWIEKNLPFTDRTARNYMKIFNNRERLKTETVSDLNTAYKFLLPTNSELDAYSLYIRTIIELSKKIIKESKSLDEILKLKKLLSIVSQDCASLLLDAETQVGELLKVA